MPEGVGQLPHIDLPSHFHGRKRVVVCQSEFVNAPPIRVGEMLGVLLLLGGDFPECLAPCPGSGEFDKSYKTNFQIPHYAPRWGGWGLTLTSA